MKKIITLILVFSLQFLVLKGQITADKTSGCAPLTGVQFTSNIDGDWDFGDGGTGTGTNPQASFGAPGEYNVIFTPSGGGDQETILIQVFGKPKPSFEVNKTTGCADFDAIFKDNSIPYEGSTITDWRWDFDDGSIVNKQNPVHTYKKSGTYEVVLITTDDNGCDTSFTAKNLITVKDPPTASFSTSTSSSCSPPLNISLTNNSKDGSGGTNNLNYTWDFGNGNTSKTRTPPSQTYSKEGVFSIVLTVDEEEGCEREFSRTVSIGKPIASIKVADTICYGVNTKFDNNSTGGSSYRWTFDDVSPSVLENPTYRFSTPGDHEVGLIVSDGICGDTTSKTVYVQKITPTVLVDPTFQCGKPYCVQFTGKGESIKFWNYSFDKGGSSTAQNPQHCYTHPSEDPYAVNFKNESFPNTTKLIGTSIHGCSGEITIVDTIHPLKPNFAPNITQGCAPLEITFSDSTNTGSPVISHSYDFGDSNFSSEENPTHVFSFPGEYEVTLEVENENGCIQKSFPVTVYVGEPISIDLNVTPEEVCIGDTVTITDATGNPNIDSYHFSTDENRGSEACFGDSTQQWSYFHKTGEHNITFYADYNGCISDTIFENKVTVNGPSSEFRWSGVCENPTNILFTATTSEINSLHWYFGDPQDSIFLSNNLNDTIVSYTYDTTGDYSVTLITTNSGSGCPNDTTTKEVNVRLLEAIIDAPSIVCTGTFTPSGANSKGTSGHCDNAFRWDLGDSTSIYLSNSPNYSKTFTDTGTYTIRLMVYDINGCRDTAEQQFIVTDLYAGFKQDTTSGCIPLTINFEDTSWSASKIVDWEWQFGNGSIDSSGAIVTNTYETYTLKKYEVLLIVEDSLGCIDTANVPINPIIPDSIFSVNDSTICEGDEVLFSLNKPNSIQSADWVFDSQGVATSLNPKFTFNNEGDFNITVEVTDTNGCVAENTIRNYVLVDAYPDAYFTLDTNIGDELCAPAPIKLTDLTIFNDTTTYGSRTWNFDKGNGALSSADQTVNGTYTQPKNYNPSLIVRSSNGCADTMTFTIPIIGPEGDFKMDKSIICLGDSVLFTLKDTSSIGQFSWDFNDGRTVDSIAPIRHAFGSVPTGGIQKIDLYLIGPKNGCKADVKKTIKIHQLEANFSLMDSTVCLDLEVEFNDSSLTTPTSTYSWNIGNSENFTVSEPLPQSYENVGAGSYVVELIIEDETIGCSDTMRKNLEILKKPTITSNDTVVCSGEPTEIYAAGGTTYSWNDSVLLESPDSSTTVVNTEENAMFTVTGTKQIITLEDTSYCFNTAISNVVVVKEIPAEEVKESCAINGQSFTFGPDSLLGGYTYDWSQGPTDNLKCLDCARQTLTIKEGIDSLVYEVIVSDPANCFPKVSKYQICVRESYSIAVPSAFTPNGIGPNNIIYVNGHGIKNLIFFRIFNRWGEMVFETKDINVGWDGTYKGSEQDMETYVYQTKAVMLNGEPMEKGGEIVLIR